MKKNSDEMRAEYSRDDLGKGVRGKHARRFVRGTNLVLLDEAVARAFPTAEAVNEALRGLLDLAEKTRTRQTSRKRAPA